MRKKNFTQIITSDDGVEHHLPHAEYNREANLTIDQVLNAAKELLLQFGRTAAFWLPNRRV